MTPRWDLRPLLAPRSIAVVGASESPDSWAPEIERSLRHLGYDGSLYPINPKYDTVWGLPCLSSIRELPRGVDLVVFVVPARVVVRMLEDCGERGVRGVMVVSSGFAEAGDEGRALQEQLRASALRLRIPVLGPNVEGFVNYIDHVAPYGTTPPPEPLAGGISVLSQSGTVAWTMNQLASDRAVGLRIILGVGNEAVLGLGDLFAWAAADPATKVVTSYIETMRDVDGIGRGLDALLAARKPVLICAPQGRSEAVRRAIVAHTGALAGNTALRDAWLRGPRRRPRRRPRHDVRGGGPALAYATRARRRRGGAAIRRRVHVVRGVGRRGRPAPARLRPGDEARAPAPAAVVRVAEQPARRDRPGRGGDRDVRRGAGGARAGPVGRAGGVRRVPAPAAGRAAVGRSGPRRGRARCGRRRAWSSRPCR